MLKGVFVCVCVGGGGAVHQERHTTASHLGVFCCEFVS